MRELARLGDHHVAEATGRKQRGDCNEHTPDRLAGGWIAAREKLLVKEKEHMRAGDALAAERRRMPWMAVEKEYKFDGPDGPATLLDLFEGRRQLVVYRAFYAGRHHLPGGRRLPGAGLRRLLLRADQVAHPAHERAGHDTRVRLARTPRPRSRT